MTPLTQALTSALIHFFWQGIAVGVLLGIALLMLRRNSANSRYVASCIALLSLAAAPLVTGWVSYRFTEPTPGRSSGPSDDASAPSTVVSVSMTSIPENSIANLQPWVLPLWAAGTMVFALRLAWAGSHAHSLRRRGIGADVSIQSAISDLAQRVGIRRRVQVLMSSLAEVPSVVGWFRPVILLPAAVAVGLTPQQLEAVLTHELAHVRRHDYLVNVFQMVVETLLFYHPAVWWISSRIRYERELCCDDFAVRSCGDAVSYARALVQLEKLRPASPTFAMGSATGPVFHRVQRLLGSGRPEHGPSRLTCAVGLVTGVLCVGIIVNARAGQTAIPLQPGEVVAASQAELPPVAVPPAPPAPAVSPVRPVQRAPALPVQAIAPPARPVQRNAVPAAPALPVAPPAPPAQPGRVPAVPVAPVAPPPAPSVPPSAVRAVPVVPAAPPAPPPQRIVVPASPVTRPMPSQSLPASPVPIASTALPVRVPQSPPPDEGPRWVLFRGNDVLVHGTSADEEQARRARRSFTGDLLWFQVDGKAYVTQDKDTLQRIQGSGSTESAERARTAEAAALQSQLRQVESQNRINDQQRALREVQRSIEQADRLRSASSNATPPQQQNMDEFRRQLEQLRAENARLGQLLAQRESEVRKIEREVRAMESGRSDAQRNAEFQALRDIDLLRGAVKAGTAQPAP